VISLNRLIVLFRVASVCTSVLLAPRISEGQRIEAPLHSKSGLAARDLSRSVRSTLPFGNGSPASRESDSDSRSVNPSATRQPDTGDSIMAYAVAGAVIGALAGYALYRSRDDNSCEDYTVWSPTCGAVPWVTFGGAIGFGLGAWVGHLRIPKR
jgi:hypothetical protein